MRILCALLAAALSAQTLPTAFEVATVRPRKDGSQDSRTNLRPGGRIEASNVTLQRMIIGAYDVTEQQVVDAPAWVSEARWDVEAKAEGMPANARPNDVLPLVQKLLAERFALKVRREMRQMPVYRLVVDSGGHKLSPPAKPEGNDGVNTRVSPQGITMEAQRANMGRLAQQLSRRVGRAVVDRTGLTGIYDFKLEWAQEMSAAEQTGPSIFTAVREQLGLRLEAGQDAVEVLVVESVSQPLEN